MICIEWNFFPLSNTHTWTHKHRRMGCCCCRRFCHGAAFLLRLIAVYIFCKWTMFFFHIYISYSFNSSSQKSTAKKANKQKPTTNNLIRDQKLSIMEQQRAKNEQKIGRSTFLGWPICLAGGFVRVCVH